MAIKLVLFLLSKICYVDSYAPTNKNRPLLIISRGRFIRLDDLSHHSLDDLNELSLGLCTYKLVHYLTVFDEKDSRYVANAELTRKLWVAIHIALADSYTTLVVLSQLLDNRTYHLARTAPSSPKVYNNILVLLYKSFEALICNL